jgi:hypothetical protein
MKFHLIPITLVCLGSFSCDKAKQLSDQARAAMEAKIAKAAGESGDTATDPELQKLVDQTSEGVIFRKDLPFPTHVEVKTTTVHQLSGRTFQSSEIETQASVVKGTQTSVTLIERQGDQIRHTMEQSTFADPVPEGADDSKKPVVRNLAPASQPRIFKKSGSTWKADASAGFRGAALSSQLAPVFDQLIIENALAPRSLWFSKTRLKIGEQLTVTGKTLPMLLEGNAKGSLSLTLESIGSINGHPCGVFAVKGDYSRKQVPDFEGVLTDEEVAIESGKLWLSLIYPLVLREEYDAIRSYRVGGSGSPGSRGQGSVKVSVIREWKVTSP